MKKNLDNRELNIINRFLHGDHEAYSLLYKEHVQELFSYGKALTSNDERLKDAIQDVFYKKMCIRDRNFAWLSNRISILAIFPSFC